MDHAAVKNKDYQLAAAASAAAAKKKPTTLLDAFEVECIRRELERLVLKQQMNQQAAVDRKIVGEKAAALGAAHGHHGRDGGGSKSTTTTKTAARKVKVSPSTAAPLPLPPAATAKKATKGARGAGGVRLLGRHAVAICSGTVPVSAAARGAVVSGGGRRRGGYREVEKV